MFHVKTKIKRSPLHGIGLFADEEIHRGKRIYTENPKLDRFFTRDEFVSFSADEKATIRHYGFFDSKKKMWHLSFDDIRFTNHASDGNMTLREGMLVAKKDIKKGEEITQDYGEFEQLRKAVKGKK